MALASDTLAVLMSAGLPVLVTHTGEPSTPAHAIGIIRDEHRSMAAVMHAWMDTLSRARAQGSAPEASLMRAMLRYLQEFPAAVHHPKEETHLFSRLRERDAALAFELDELEQQHVRDHELLAGLATRVEALAQAGGGDAAATAVAALEQAVQDYAAFLWNHLGREEAVILPAAQRCLTAEDWQHIDAAFARDRDPGFGAEIDRACRHLFSRIVNAEQGVH
jgi:hemerythrin-like domain-containing protein